MSGVTDLPFRRTAKQLGAGMVVSEMIASWAMIRENQKTLGMAEIDGCGGVSAVQLAGCDPAAMAEAARLAVDKGAHMIDINFGCPVKKVAVGQAAGSALMRDEVGGGGDPGGDRQGGPGAGYAQDAHGLGPRQPECAAAGSDCAGRGHSHGHGPWSHAAAILHRHRRLGVCAAGEAGDRYPGHRQRRHPHRGRRRHRSAHNRAPTA